MFEERLLPNNLEAEEAVLGSVLIDPGSLAELIGKLDQQDFYREKHGLVWKAYQTLFRNGLAPDQVTVGRALEVQGNTEAVGGMAYLSQLVANTPTSAHGDYYLAIVLETSRLRGIIHQAGNWIGQAYDGVGSQEISQQAVHSLLTLRTGQEDRRPRSTSELYSAYQADLIAELDGNEDTTLGATTGFRSLDYLLRGWQKGLLYVLGARTSMGKTLLAQNCITKLASRGEPVFLFALETTAKEMFRRMMYGMARIESGQYRKLAIDSNQRETQRDQLIDTMGRIDQLPIHIDDRRGLTAMDIRATLLSHTQAFGDPALVVIDYLNLVKAEGHRRSQYEQVSDTVKALKDIGGELELPILLLAQLSREPERRSDSAKRPGLSDFRDAGTIEEVASCVIGLYRASYYYQTEAIWKAVYPNEPYPRATLEVHVLKQQAGPIGMIPLYCEIESGFMGDMGVAR